MLNLLVSNVMHILNHNLLKMSSVFLKKTLLSHTRGRTFLPLPKGRGLQSVFLMIPIDLSNKVAVITGGSGALGRVMVRTLAEAGADIAICYYRDQETAHLLQDEITAKGVRAAVVQADVTDQGSINAMRDAVSEQLGSADIIVNNAVIQYSWTSVLEQSAADYESQFQSCVLHNVYMAQAFVPAMIESGWGRVVSINTECSMQNFERQSAYTSGKRGMDGVLRVLAKEVGAQGVHCQAFVPAMIKLPRDGLSVKRVKRARPMNIIGVGCQCNVVGLPKKSPTSCFFLRQISRVTSRVRIFRCAVGM